MSFNISYRIEAIDKFSAVSRQISKSLQNVQDKAKATSASIDGMGKKFKKIGGDLKFLSAASAGLIAGSIMAWSDEASAIAQVEASIKSTGGAARLTMAELSKAASNLQATTLFQDDEILSGVTQNLLLFKNVSGETFLAAQGYAADLATKLKIDLKSATMIVGKALNSPADGLGALRKAGIKLTDSQESLIKALAETGHTAEAQKIILAELKSSVGGAAIAAAGAGAGSFIILKNAIGDASEDIGGIIAQRLIPLAKILTGLAQKFKEASPFVKNLVAIMLVLFAVVAPVLAVIGMLLSGLAALITIGGTVAGVLAGLTLPFILWAVAIGAVVLALLWLWSNWDSVSSWIGDRIESVTTWFSDMVTSIKGFFMDLASFAKKIFDSTPLGMLVNMASGLFKDSKSSAMVDINLNDPGGAVQSVQTRSQDNGVSFNVGQNMGASA